MTALATPTAPQKRLASLDQFRGYTVAGMFLVNFLGGFIACPFLLQHKSTYCSYADTIMPQFFFAVGFSLRLSFGRRAMQEGLGRAYWHVIKRLLGLALVAIVVYQGSPDLPKGATFDWQTIHDMGFWNVIKGPLKRDWFQTLMHIAVTSLWILPVIRLRPSWRILYMLMSAVLHVALSHVFNFEWVNGVPEGPSGIDGGPLGFLTWTIPTMVGTLACDVALAPISRAGVVARLVGWGIVLMAFGWLASCGTRWYDVTAPEGPIGKATKLAKNPVLPDKAAFDEWMTALKNRDWNRVRAEWPFVPPPNSRVEVEEEAPKAKETDDQKSADAKAKPKKKKKTEDHSYEVRKWNYWMMSQRAGSISYLTFAAGLSLVLYALFYVLSDVLGLTVGVFRTLGSNALFGYVLHDIVGDAVKKFVPNDCPASVMWIAFGVFFFICWLIIRSLEKKNIYIKL